MDDNKFSDQSRFGDLTFSDFKKMALNPALSCYEKIGFPNHYRANKEESIFLDILSKLDNLPKQEQVIVDVGPGCSTLAFKLIEYCAQHHHELILIDSQEMLAQLPNESFITKIAGFYPSDCKDFLVTYQKKVDAILAYSMLHYVFQSINVFEFMDQSLSLLADGGQFLIGDIPNTSKRKRFLSSANGIKHHQTFYDAHTLPQVDYNKIESQQMDDGVLLGFLMRARLAGFDAYLMPQKNDLPMANRREDLLIIKP